MMKVLVPRISEKTGLADSQTWCIQLFQDSSLLPVLLGPLGVL
jgi:hypothetical protein